MAKPISSSVITVAFFLLLACAAAACPPTNYSLILDEQFAAPFHLGDWISDGNPDCWISHTPYAGDFGDAWFSGFDEPNAEAPTTVVPGNILDIHAYWDGFRQHWRSGLIASVDQVGVGFSHAGESYWECLLWWDGTNGTWPAFWLDGGTSAGFGSQSDMPIAEIDVTEMYGIDPTISHETVHVWLNGNETYTQNTSTQAAAGQSYARGWHTFAVWINPTNTIFYIDNNQVWSTPTQPAFLQTLYCMVDLALGSGFPDPGIDGVGNGNGNPSHLYVKHIRCWAP
jgi:Glycosyl hydrolases family 16